MSDPGKQLEQGLAAWRKLGWPSPSVLVVSGSGLAVDLGTPVEGPAPLAEILPFPLHGVEGHPHRIELLEPVPGRFVLYLRGRIHAYQGYDANESVYAVRLGGLLGARTLLMTNAAGGLDPDDRPGRLKLISDHLNLSGLNPLRGRLPAEWGPQFPDMSMAYDPDLRSLLRSIAAEHSIELGEAVYAGLSGPSYETPAEIRMLQRLGAGLCGMSTVLEIIAANHLGLRCAVLSLVTNLAAGLVPGRLDHREVMEAGEAAAAEVQTLLAAAIAHPDLLHGD